MRWLIRIFDQCRKNIILLLSKIKQTIIGCQFRFDKEMIHHYRNESVMIVLQTTLVMISLFVFMCFKSDRKLFLNPYFIVKPNMHAYGVFYLKERNSAHQTIHICWKPKRYEKLSRLNIHERR